VDVLVEKTGTAAKEKGVDTVTAGGGVAANGYLRASLQAACDKNGLRLVLPERRYCTDNAAMIASEGSVQFKLGNFADMSLTAKASIPLAATLETVQSRAAKKAGE
jgi:N6-L-threonylcarbamoyladenine synthase